MAIRSHTIQLTATLILLPLGALVALGATRISRQAGVAVAAPRQLTLVYQDEPMYSPDGSRILYVDKPEGVGNIFMMDTNPKRPNPVRITRHAMHDDGPVWSPDGKRIAFSATDRATKVTEIFVVDATGGEPRQITHDHVMDIHPAWSPDGRRLLYTSSMESKDQSKLDVLQSYIIDVDGPDAKPRRVPADGPVNSYASWSPDGKRILFRKKTENAQNSEVFLMDSDGTHVVNLTRHPGYDRYPMFSPDAGRIVFESNRPGHSQILLMNADGSDVRVLVDGPGQLSAPRFSPDGKLVIYPRELDGEIKIFTVDVP
jgi:TolB protein